MTWSADSWTWEEPSSWLRHKNASSQSSAKMRQINLVGYGIPKILHALPHMAWMKIHFIWLLIRLTHKKDNCLSPAQTRNKISPLTDLCTLHNLNENLNGPKILVVRFIRYRMYSFGKTHPQRWEIPELTCLAPCLLMLSKTPSGLLLVSDHPALKVVMQSYWSFCVYAQGWNTWLTFCEA